MSVNKIPFSNILQLIYNKSILKRFYLVFYYPLWFYYFFQTNLINKNNKNVFNCNCFNKNQPNNNNEIGQMMMSKVNHHYQPYTLLRY